MPSHDTQELIFCYLQVGKKVLWPILGLMKDTMHDEDIDITLDDMDEKSVTLSASQASLKSSGKKESKTGCEKAGRKRSRLSSLSGPAEKKLQQPKASGKRKIKESKARKQPQISG